MKSFFQHEMNIGCHTEKLSNTTIFVGLVIEHHCHPFFVRSECFLCFICGQYQVLVYTFFYSNSYHCKTNYSMAHLYRRIIYGSPLSNIVFHFSSDLNKAESFICIILLCFSNDFSEINIHVYYSSYFITLAAMM